MASPAVKCESAASVMQMMNKMDFFMICGVRRARPLLVRFLL